MFGWLRPQCPIDLSQAVAVDQYMSRLAQTLGLGRLRAAVAVRPTPEYFPEPYGATGADAHRLHDRVCSWMGVDLRRAPLELAEPDEGRSVAWGVAYYPGDPGRLVVSPGRLDDPMKLTASLAHGLAHLLLGDAGLRLAGWRQNALAECLTVFRGLGVFPANATIQQKNAREGRVYRWSIRRDGALTERQFGYALALFAWLRDERPAPAWAEDLQVNVREPFAQSLKYLAKTGDCQFKAEDDEAGLTDDARLSRRIEALASPSRGARLAALWDLGKWGPGAAAALDPVMSLLRGDDAMLQVEAADALGGLGSAAETAVPALADAALQDHDRGLRSTAAAALGSIGRKPEAAVPVLTYLLKSETPNERILAAWALGRFGSDAAGAVGPLTEMLQEGNDAVAAEAAYALGAIGGIAVAAVPALIEALRRGEGALPAGAAYALGCMGSAAAQKAVSALRKALRHMNAVVVEEAADALRRLGFADVDVAAAGRPSGAKRSTAVYQLDPRYR